MDLGLRVKKINDLMAKRGNYELKKLGLTFSQFHCLVYLEKCAGQQAPLKQLENHFESDKRVKIVCLTDEGRQICVSAKKGMHKLQEKVEQLYSRQELSQMEKYLDRLYELLAEENREACEEKDDQ